jgi:hypothetical protein
MMLAVMAKKERCPQPLKLGSRGGKARAKKLTAAQRSEIAKKAVAAREAKRQPKK